MIRFSSVSKCTIDEEHRRHVVLDKLNLDIPTNRRVAIVGHDLQSATRIMHLLAGSETPDQGHVATIGPQRLSPLVYGGGALMPQLTGFQNIAFYARAHRLDTLRLVEIVDGGCQLGLKLHKYVRTLDRNVRRELEATLVAALPFDCFLVDRLHELPGDLRWRIFLAARLRKAGFIFTTSQMDVAERFGEFFIVMRDAEARSFNKLSRAIRYMNDEKIESDDHR
jgi:capsular polysaccharide transport system ATP-binding protein